jgi:DNA-binding phage protein
LILLAPKQTQFKRWKQNMKKSASSHKTIKIKQDAGLSEFSPTQELLDEELIALAIWECLKNNDPEGIAEVIQAHLEAVNKAHAARNALLPRSSMYNALKGKNPTIKTLAKLVTAVDNVLKAFFKLRSLGNLNLENLNDLVIIAAL